MNDGRFLAFLFMFFFAGYIVYLNEFYSTTETLFMATVAVVLVYLIPVALVKIIQGKGYTLVSGIFVATIWEFSMAALARVLAFPAWESFLLAGVGGALTTAFLAFVRQGKEKRNENAVEAQT
ncbi:hypothetical protein [Thermococcus aciditolerans]|uniref:Uncharacterized protein n=1 Tax=Thermococcus aciditolerans TaxID=2598455 RepID=A0A5C0SJD6_9EURY|nr:hypothetical protein [Thermococcus aciditolerans]QEK14112.1 hypothetical protein FPV09_02145 [Thermococcus aciditolerans]